MQDKNITQDIHLTMIVIRLYFKDNYQFDNLTIFFALTKIVFYMSYFVQYRSSTTFSSQATKFWIKI